MNEISHDTYLGDIIMNNGSNELNILARASKGQGKVTEIVNILEKVTFGTHYFKVAKLLRESNFLNGIMTNSEVWYGVTQKQVEQLEAVDKLLLRNFLGTPISTPLEGVQLEFGVLSIGTIMKARRINFLHYLLQTQENEMLSKFFQGQLNQPVKQDWTEQVGKDLKDFKIELTHEEIKSETADKFKLFVKRKSIEFEFEKLMRKKQTHSKMDKLSYHKLEMQDYLKVNKLSAVGGKTLFRYRTHMANYGQNFGSTDICPLCGLHLDNQFMAYYNCQVIKDNVNIRGEYENIFKDEVPADVIRSLIAIDKFRKDKI